MPIFSSLWEKLRRSEFWKSVATLSAGQIIAQMINLISIPIISRIYSKDAYGEFGIVTSTAIIVIGFIGMGLGSAIMAPESDEESEKIFRTSFSIQVILAFIICNGMLLIMPFYRFFTSKIPYPAALLIMFTYIILTALSSLLNVYINRLKMNKVLFINPLITASSNVLLTLPLGLLGFDYIGLYAAGIVSLLIMNLQMLRRANPLKKMPSVSEALFVIKKYKDFVIYQYPSGLMGTFTTQMPNQILAKSFGNQALGDYAMCSRVFGMPSQLIATPIQTVYFRTVAQKYRSGENIADFTYSLISKILLVGIIPIILLMAFGKEIFAFVLGDKWGSAGTIAAILALQFLFIFCYSCITYCRVVIEKQKVNLYTTIFQFVIIIASLIMGIGVFKTLIGTITCFALANLIYNIVNIAITFYCLKKYAIRFLIFSIIYCILSAGFSILLRYFLHLS